MLLLIKEESSLSLSPMAANTEILIDCSPLFRILKDGSIDRMVGTDFEPAGHDPTTGVTSKDVTINPETNLSARIFLPPNPSKSKLPILVFFHGGAFLIESPFSAMYNRYLITMVSTCHIIVVSVDYRLAPEYPLPIGYNDSLDTVKWVLSRADDWLVEHGNYEKVFLAGDRAGGNIAHNVIIQDISAEIEGVILFHPFFGGSESIYNDDYHIMAADLTKKLWKYACPETDGVDDPRMNPMAKDASSLKGLNCKRLMLCVADKDGSKEWQMAYFEAVKKSGWGGQVEFYGSEGGEHVLQVLMPDCDESKKLMSAVVSFIAS